mgnify:CR=1 FL=1
MFEKVGEMLVGDLLLHNWDRFRLRGLWDGAGNPGNVLTTNQWGLISIDHEIDCRPEANHDVINEKIERLLDEVTSVAANARLEQLSSLVEGLARASGTAEEQEASGKPEERAVMQVPTHPRGYLHRILWRVEPTAHLERLSCLKDAGRIGRVGLSSWAAPCR